MTRRTLFARLCTIGDALQAEIAIGRLSRRTLALHAILAQVDQLIDHVIDDPVREDLNGLAFLLEGQPCNDSH